VNPQVTEEQLCNMSGFPIEALREVKKHADLRRLEMWFEHDMMYFKAYIEIDGRLGFYEFDVPRSFWEAPGFSESNYLTDEINIGKEALEKSTHITRLDLQ